MNKNPQLKHIFSDLRLLIETDEILAKDLENFLSKLRSKDVINFINALSKGSKPEQALREVFFTNNSKFSQFLFKDVFPEVRQESGFIDYLIKAQREEISLEIKPLFNGIFEKKKSGKIFLKIKKLKLNPKDHKNQILKYLKGTREFVVLTNLEDWYLFSKSYSLDQECNPFGYVKLFDLLEDFKQVEDFWHYLDKQEDLSVKEPLDKKFFNSLKNWVNELSEVKFDVDDNRKTELIINLLNKFIFIQSLDKFWVIGHNYISEEWLNIERKWTAKNKQRILRKFLEDINEYFYELYDTELFKIIEENKTILDFIEQEQENINLFYNKFKLILGIDYGKSTRSWIPGIIQYNFRRIDEDILGKSYETFLAEIRKEQGIYYTPKYITNYIVNNTIQKQFKKIIENFSKSLELKEYRKCNQLLNDLISIKILDPACGSGSFLIKALRIIWIEYNKLNDIIEKQYNKCSEFKGTLVREKKIEDEFKEILELKNRLNFNDKRILISKIIIRHIHGVDLDNNAIEVAKLNLWLEAIKLAPKDFQFDRVPVDTNHILPDLEMNLCNGDSLVGLPEEEIINFLKSKHKNELKLLFELRNQYLKEPVKIELVRQIDNLKSNIKKELDNSFEDYLKEKNISIGFLEETKPFYWPLEFWYVFFNDDIKPKIHTEIGFNVIIGNPPYFTIRGKGTGTLVQTYSYNYLQNAPNWKDHFRSQSDIYYYFIIKSIKLLKQYGNFGFIIESYWIENDYADRLKEMILNNIRIEILIRFGKVKKIFEDADNDTCILLFEKSQQDDQKIKYVYCKNNFSIGTQQQNNQKLVNHIIENIDKEDFSDEYIDIYLVNQKNLGKIKWVLSKLNKIEIIEKIELEKKILGGSSGFCDVGQGVVPGRKKEFRITSKKEAKDAGGYWISIGDAFIEVVDNATNQIHKLESQFLKPLITNSGIRRYFLIDSDEYLIYTVPLQDGRFNIEDYSGILNYLKVYENELKNRYDFDGEKYPWYGYQRIQNIELFENSQLKILCPYRAIENSFALDEIGYFGTTDMYAIVPKSEHTININYLLGVLNSRVLTFWYKEAGKSKGLILEFFANPLSRMPIYQASEEEQIIISHLVSKIILLKKANQKFNEIWIENSEKFRNGTITFEKLVLNDKKQIQKGNFEKIWISEINNFPDSNDPKINTLFRQFNITINKDDNLKIYGIQDSDETLLLDLKTKTKEFRDIIYLELIQLFSSRKKINNLKDIFSKTVISIIKPNIWENTSNLIKFSRKKFQNWLLDEKLSIKEIDPIQLDNLILDLEDNIDAYVFKYYNLSSNEVDIIFNSLNMINSKRKGIKKKFDEII